MRNINNIIKAVYGNNGLEKGNQQSAQPQVAADNPLQIYSQNITDSYTENQYDYDAAARRRNEAMAEYQNMLEPQRRLNEDYVNGLNEIYKRYSPDKIEPARQDERLAGIQSLATALSDLGRAAGKSLGNNDGLGMVTVDDTRKFDNNLNYLKQAQANYRKAQMDAANTDLQRQLAMNDLKYKQDKDLMQQGLAYGQKAYEKALENSKRSRTYSTKYENPNSEEAKERAAKIQREIDNEKWKREMDIANLNAKKERNAISRANAKKDNDKELNSLSNITFGKPNIMSKYRKKLYDQKDAMVRFFTDELDTFEMTDDQVDAFYRRFYPQIKADNTDAEFKTKPKEQLVQVETLLSKMKDKTSDEARKIYEAYWDGINTAKVLNNYTQNNK